MEYLAPDPILAPILDDFEGAQADGRLSSLLMEHADPIIRRVVRRTLGSRLDLTDGRERTQDALEVQQDILLRLLAGLRRADSSSGIADFRAYVAVISYNACHDCLRRRHPARARLRDQLRYVLTHRSDFTLWHDPTRGSLCGRAGWREEGRLPASGTLRGLAAGAALSDLRCGPETSALESGIAAIFERVGAPVDFDALVDTVASLAGVGETDSTDTVQAVDLEARLPARTPDVASVLERRGTLLRLWREILDLPLAQRQALLLNLRDGDGTDTLALLPMSGVASIRSIASAVGMEANALAEIWHDLPWNDDRIAAHLGLTRQQVINLRKSARARLARRMRSLSSGGGSIPRGVGGGGHLEPVSAS